MARHWFTLLPNPYYMRPIARGGRNEILFTALGKFKYFLLIYDKKHWGQLILRYLEILKNTIKKEQ